MYCKNCKNIQITRFKKKLILISKNKIKRKSKCVICLIERTFIHKTDGKYDLESELEINFQFFTDWCYKKNMETYSVKCRKNTKIWNSKIFKTKNGRLIMQSKCNDCGIKKSRFVKKQEAKCLLSNLGIKTPLSKIPVLNVLF